MTETADKDSIIRQVYYDIDTGFDSVINTYRKANKISSSITLADVKAFLDKQSHGRINRIEDLTVMSHQKHYMNFRLTSAIGHRVQKITMDLDTCFWPSICSAHIFIVYHSKQTTSGINSSI